MRGTELTKRVGSDGRPVTHAAKVTGDDRRRVLVVEADIASTASLLAQITSDGLVLERAERASEAITRLAAGGIDAVLLDLELPDRRGLATLAALRAADPLVPVVVVTGAGEESVGAEARRIGAQELLPRSEACGERLDRAVREAIARGREASAERTRCEQDAVIESMEQVMGFVCHELRAPLAGIRAVIELYGAGINGDPAAALADVRELADRMTVLIEDMLVAAREQRGAMHWRWGPADAAVLSRSVAEDCRRRGLPGGPAIRCDLADGVRLPLRGDGMAVRRLLINLSENARRHARSYVEIGAEVTTLDGGSAIRLRVADDGPGIGDKSIDLIGRPWATSGTSLDGFGLGLAICRQIVLVHGGRLVLRSGEDGTIAEAIIRADLDGPCRDQRREADEDGSAAA